MNFVNFPNCFFTKKNAQTKVPNIQFIRRSMRSDHAHKQRVDTWNGENPLFGNLRMGWIDNNIKSWIFIEKKISKIKCLFFFWKKQKNTTIKNVRKIVREKIQNRKYTYILFTHQKTPTGCGSVNRELRWPVRHKLLQSFTVRLYQPCIAAVFWLMMLWWRVVGWRHPFGGDQKWKLLRFFHPYQHLVHGNPILLNIFRWWILERKGKNLKKWSL